MNCTALKTAILPEGLESIGYKAFHSCSAMNPVLLPEGLKSIGDYAFSWCAVLRTVLLPESLKSIGDHAFKGCDALRTALLPEGLESIGEWAFYGDESLEFVTIPTTVTSIGEYAFGALRDSSCKLLNIAVDLDNLDARAGVLSADSLKRKRVTIVDLSESRVQGLCESRIIDEPCREYATKMAMDSPARAGAAAGKKELTDAESLTAYLKVIAEAETSVMQLVESLALASSIRRRLEETTSCIDALQKERQQTRQATEQGKQDAERRAVLSGARLSASEIGRRPLPPRLESEPLMPKKPMLERPGFFNRRMVEAKNAAAEQEYQEALATYEAETRRVPAENLKRIKEYEEALAKWERSRDSAIQKQLSELEARPRRGSKIAEDSSDVALAWRAATYTSTAMCKELEDQLREASALHKLAYSADVIFPKYRNIEAMTTMYEYFETGRCTSLKGPDGAYNLYETELRSKAIIGKLDVVSDKLDVISDQLRTMQASQYVLYKAVEGVDKRLDAMSRTLSDILGETTTTRHTVQEISAKATMMVRSSAEIAYWARKNAELTDSLGYLFTFTSL